MDDHADVGNVGAHTERIGANHPGQLGSVSARDRVAWK
jgi:hypothetical protein